jgi:mRNA interferase RelE/StbE
VKYSVEIKPRAERELDVLPRKMLTRVLLTIDRLKIEPRPLGPKKLRGVEDYWRIRIGDYRILYGIGDKTRQVRAFRVLHRKEAYR